jgi:predicted transposase/invertase (TIGR01784 family)
MSKNHIRFDWAAKKILRDKANFDILEGFLSELLKEDIKVEGLLESESNQDDEDEKFNRVDLYAENAKGEHIIIEIQNTRELDYLMRMLFSTAKTITEKLAVGAKYSDIKKVIAVSIVYFDLGSGDDYIYVGQTKFIGLHNKSELQLTTVQKKMFGKQHVHQTYPEYYLIKAEKFNNVINEPLDEWIYFFKNSEVLDNFRAKGMKEVREKLIIMNMSEEERKKYKKYVERLSDEASYAETLKLEAEEKVREDERIKTEKRKDVEMAVKCIKKGYPNSEITELTGLTDMEIKNLRKEVEKGNL